MVFSPLQHPKYPRAPKKKNSMQRMMPGLMQFPTSLENSRNDVLPVNHRIIKVGSSRSLLSSPTKLNNNLNERITSTIGRDSTKSNDNNNFKPRSRKDLCHIELTPTERNHRRWYNQIKNLKKEIAFAESSKHSINKPFGKFSDHRISKPVVQSSPKHNITKLSNKIPNNSVATQTTVTSTASLNNNTVREIPTPTTREQRRVRFVINEDTRTEKSMHDDVSTLGGTYFSVHSSSSSSLSSNSTKKSLARQRSKSNDNNNIPYIEGLDNSNHRCQRKNVILDFKNNLYYTKQEIEKMFNDAKIHAKSFRDKRPATVIQIDTLFEEFCNNKDSNMNDERYRDEEEEEEEEEILRNFLQDWTASDVRGLEEAVTGRDMFKSNRIMAIESVLAYQEKLREQQRLSDGNTTTTMLLSSSHRLLQQQNNNKSSVIIPMTDEMKEQLRARCKSTSNRARLFAMYMALGDALFVSQDDCDFY